MALIQCPVVRRDRVLLQSVYDITQGGPPAVRVGGPGESTTLTVHTAKVIQGTAPADYELVPYDQQSATMSVAVRLSTLETGPLADLSASKLVFQATGVWGQAFGVRVTSLTWTADTLTLTLQNDSWPNAVYAIVTNVTMDVDLVTRQCAEVPPPPPAPVGGASATGGASVFSLGRNEPITFYASVRSGATTMLRVNLLVRAPDGTTYATFAQDPVSYTAGQVRTYAVDWTVPGTAPLGSYTLQVEVRSSDNGAQLALAEQAARFSVVQQQVASVTVRVSTATAQPGQVVTLTARVTNLSATARAFVVDLELRGPVAGTVSVSTSTLAPSASEERSGDWTAPAAEGTYTIAATVWDPGRTTVLAQQDIAASIVVGNAQPPPPPPPTTSGPTRGFRLRWTRRRVPGDVAVSALGVPVRITLDRLGFQDRPMLLVGIRRRVSVARDRGGVQDEHEYWLAPWPNHESATDSPRWAQVDAGYYVVGDTPSSTLAARVERAGRIMPG